MKKLMTVVVSAIAALAAAGSERGVAVTPAMSVAKPGDVKPRGWLLDRARAARDGFTGHMDDVDEHFRLAWTTNSPLALELPDADGRPLVLVPYGCTKLRISAFWKR